MNTQININYTKNNTYDALSKTNNYSEDKGFSLSYSYNFSLKEGIKLPLLKKLRLTQNIGFSSNFTYNLGENYYVKEFQKTILRKSSNYNLSLSFSYNLSAYTQMGLNTAYSVFKNLLKQDKTQSIDINMWVLFRF
uniref:Outer membrane protein beta-barrel domain-containing protein n=1 Tax=candidate division WOR-3 bacterium TaxID=2052148 RepID=A0A7V4E314_UNCW3